MKRVENEKNKLIYYSKLNFGNDVNIGIKNKVFAQVKAFRNLGLETDVLSIQNNQILINDSEAEPSQSFNSKIKFLQFLYFTFLKKIKIENYDFLYIRHFLTNPLFILMLRIIKKRNPEIKIYMELPTYPYKFQGNKLTFSIKIQQFVDDICTKFFKNYIDKIVTLSLDKSIFGIETIIIDNGIDTEKYSFKKFKNNKAIHLLGLANVQSWHGFDRIIEGLAIYKNQKKDVNITFHVVGNGNALNELKELSAFHGLEDKVIFHGFLNGEELEAMFDKCDIGIGVLGLHRVNLKHASALKAREFTARGLPFIASHDDYGYTNDFPYILRVSGNDEQVKMEDIIKFFNFIQSNPNHSEEMNNYAKENFTWESQLKKVYDNFKN